MIKCHYLRAEETSTDVRYRCSLYAKGTRLGMAVLQTAIMKPACDGKELPSTANEASFLSDDFSLEPMDCPFAGE
jgi:hypothetical protein